MIHPIPPGLFCVPSALCALTGAPLEAVVVPALNRHMRSQGLLDTVPGVHMHVAQAEELGYSVRRYRQDAESGKIGAHVATWASRSLRWPGRPVLVATRDHCLVVSDGRVYDSWRPRGVMGPDHPFARTTVRWAALVEKRDG